jgi:hypothetical protein
MYCGCKGCPAKTLWAIFTILLIGGIALLAGGLVRTVPCTTDLVNCEKGLAKGSTQHTVCWDTFWTCTSGVARESSHLRCLLRGEGAARSPREKSTSPSLFFSSPPLVTFGEVVSVTHAPLSPLVFLTAWHGDTESTSMGGGASRVPEPKTAGESKPPRRPQPLGASPPAR